MKLIRFIYIISMMMITSSALLIAAPINLYVKKEKININNKTAQVYTIQQKNKQDGFIGTVGDNFNAIIHNDTQSPLTLHWHGLIDPSKEDGVPYLSQLPLMPGETEHIKFPLVQAGTFWMHSHYQLQEGSLMSAPFIILPKKPRAIAKDAKDITVMIEDYSFKAPDKILADLIKNSQKPMKGDSKPDLFDVKSDALLANRHTLNNPQVIDVQANQKIRLRMINAASANNVYIKFPKSIIAAAIAKDGSNLKPYYGQKFQLSVASRLDFIFTVPQVKEGVFPVFVQTEGRRLRTGIIFRVGDAKLPVYSEYANKKTKGFSYLQYYNMHPLKALKKRPVDRTLIYNLTGKMSGYIWGINGASWPNIKPFFIKEGQRVRMIINNTTSMAHPMHLHGHVFQLVAINGTYINGFEGDTIDVLPHSSVTLEFDANNPGIWAFHCHLMYHLAAGMFTSINYAKVDPPQFYLNKIHMTKQQYDTWKKQNLSTSTV